MSDPAFDLARFPVHLGLGALAVVEPEFDGQPSWYEAYVARHEADGVEGRLVSRVGCRAEPRGLAARPRGRRSRRDDVVRRAVRRPRAR